MPEFPLAEAKKLAQQQRLADQAALQIAYQPQLIPIVASDDECDEDLSDGEEGLEAED